MTTLRHKTGSVISALWRLRNQPLTKRAQVLMYHSIGGVAVGDQTGLYSITQESFSRQMNLLKELQTGGSVKVVPFGLETPGSISITFDDGYRDNLFVVAPLLEQLGFPFHIFLNPDLIESRSPGFLAPQEVRSLANHPLVTLGLHGRSHKPLTSLSDEALQTELRDAQNWFSQQTGIPATSISYPHGSVNDRVVSEVKNSGFSRAACSKFGPIVTHSDRFRIPRIDIWSSDSDHSFLGKIYGRWDWMKWRT